MSSSAEDLAERRENFAKYNFELFCDEENRCLLSLQTAVIRHRKFSTSYPPRLIRNPPVDTISAENKSVNPLIRQSACLSGVKNKVGQMRIELITPETNKFSHQI